MLPTRTRSKTAHQPAFIEEIDAGRPQRMEPDMTFKVDSVPHYFETLAERFNAAGAKGVKAVYQFELSGDDGGTWHAEIQDQSIAVHEGEHAKPTTTLKMKADEFISMTNGDLDGNMAYMSGKLKVAGNLMMAMKMRAILPQASK